MGWYGRASDVRHVACGLQAAEAEEVAQLIAAAKATPKGARKDVSGAMPKAYYPKCVAAHVHAGARKGGREGGHVCVPEGGRASR